MDLQPGTTLMHYRIVDKLGEGGMGVVWRAVDGSLGREVAIKVLPAGVAGDPDRIARFEREARLLASLNHPHIAAIHGLHRVGGTHFLAMELVAGEDLAQRLHAGPMSLDVALRIAHQLSLALAAAHRAGVVHRDLKPANIRVATGSDVKVLDFGLAKALAADAGPGARRDPSLSPTMTSAGTMAGVILGTAAYMSPEQARGEEVDQRADIWAFGVVLYEMLTGASPFSGRTASDTLAAVLTREPDWQAVPYEVRRLLRACLQKEPDRRLRDIADAWLLLDEPFAAANAGPARTGGWWRPAAALVAGAAITAAAFVYLAQPPPLPSMRFLEHPPAGTQFAGPPVPAPDGSHLAMIVIAADGARHIWIRSIARETAQLIEDTTGADFVTWSPDSSELAFRVNDELRRIRRDGGGSRLIANVGPGDGMAWASDGELFVASRYQGIQQVASAGGTPRSILGVDGANYRDVDVMPAGAHMIIQQFGEQTGLYVAGLDGRGFRSLLTGVNSKARFLPPDHLLYQDSRVLMAQRLDPAQMTMVGEPQPIAENVEPGGFEVGRSGIVSYVQGSATRQRLTWFDRHGNVTSTIGPESLYSEIYLSPAGDHLVYVDADPVTGNRDLWTRDLLGGAPNRLTAALDVDHLVAISPDGRDIVWEAHSGSDLLMMGRPADGSAAGAPVREWNRGGGPTDWSPDGKYVLYTSYDGATETNIWAVPMDDDGEPFPLIEAEFSEGHGRFSPDGRWLAYVSDATGTDEIYLQRLDGMATMGGPQRLSTGGGEKLHWRADGGELYFVAGTVLMAVEVRLDTERPAGAPRVLFDLGARQENWDYVPAPDGQSFLAIVQAGDSAARPATVILNWTPEGR